MDLASDDLVSNDDSNCIVPIPREEVVELRTCVHDTNGTFNISFEEWSKITKMDGDKIALGMIGPICLVPNWRIHLFGSENVIFEIYTPENYMSTTESKFLASF